METSIRDFIRNFKQIRKAAESGTIIRIKTARKIFVFRLEREKSNSLLGCCAEYAPKISDEAGPVEDPDSWHANQDTH